MASGQPDYTRAVAVTVIDTPDTINVEVANTSPPLNVTFPSTQDVNVLSMPTSSGIQIKGQDAKLTTTPDFPYISGLDASYENAAFVTGSSPATHDIYAALGRNGRSGYIYNAGAGNLQYQFSVNGTNYGGAHTLIAGSKVEFSALDISKIKITWIADTAYYIFVV